MCVRTHLVEASAGRKTVRGFTLMEIIVVVALFSILTTLGLFMSMETLRGTLSRSEGSVIVSLLQKARSRAMNNIEQSPWGLCYQNGAYTLFKGLTCAAGEETPANANASTTGLITGVVFSQLAGTTTPTTVVLTQNGRTGTTSINYEGTIIW